MSDSTETVFFSGDEAFATLPEGNQRQMKLGDLIASLAPRVPDTCGAILPDGLKCAIPVPGGVALVHQTPPQIYSFQWIHDDSEQDYGPGTKYRTVRLALPYVVVIAVFSAARRGALVLSDKNECYFSNEPLEAKGLETELRLPALLNCSAMQDAFSRPLSWICTQYLPREELQGTKTLDASVRASLAVLLRHLLESGFNRSSEQHEGASGFSKTVEAGVDPRVASVDAWEEATNRDPLFALEVPWLTTGQTLAQGVDRPRDLGRASKRLPHTAGDIARLIFTATNPRRRKK